MYLHWGLWPFQNAYNHALDLINFKMTNHTASETNTEVDGDTQTNNLGREPITVSFELHYVYGYTNQELEVLAEFWQDRLNEEWPMTFGGKAPDLIPNPMKLVKVDFPTLKQRSNGRFVQLIVELEFREVITDETEPVTNLTTGVDIGAY